MEKIKLEKIKDYLYYEKIDNGLDVYMFPKRLSNSFHISFTTRFGSSDLTIKDEEKAKEINLKKGLAHFLEHQMFETKEGNAFTKFDELGNIANAYTTIDNTTYEVTGFNHFKECLTTLLDFVQTPYFDEKNIDIERNIIKEEIEIDKNNPETFARNKLNEMIYKKDAQKYLITGSIDDIKRIHAIDLLQAYNYFYHPENMFIVITGNFLPLEALAIIKENQKNKKFRNYKKITHIQPKEPKSVNKKIENIDLNIKVPLILVAYKLNKKLFKDISKLSMYLDAFMYLSFGKSSDFAVTLNNENIITSWVDYYINETDSSVVLSLILKGNYPKEIIEQIDSSLIDNKFKSQDLERYKKVCYSNYILTFNDNIKINDMLIGDILSGKINRSKVSEIRSLNIKDLNKLCNLIKNDNKSILIVK